jgi:hypothetical protein
MNFQASLIAEFVLLVNIHFPCLLKLCLFTLFFIIWQNILLIHILTILCLCFHKYLPPGYKVSPHSASGAHIQQLWGEICSTITNFAACVVLVIGGNNLPSNLQGLAVIFSHHQVCIKKKKGGHFFWGGGKSESRVSALFFASKTV